jgi:hypothetical protein
MVARPEIVVANVEELFRDEHGQYWSPARVTLTWPPIAGLRAPAITVEVIAAARPDMTLEQLHKAHLSAAHGVLNAAVLIMEEPPFGVKNDVRVPQRTTADGDDRKRKRQHSELRRPREK